MFMAARTLFLVCESPLHAGSGSSLGVVDLPIQRERHTGFPKVESSSLKGALRENFEVRLGNPKDPNLQAIFGPEDLQGGGDAHASALAFSDARLLLFPVRSMKGVFAWITCPAVLDRFLHDSAMVSAMGAVGGEAAPPEAPGEGTVSDDSALRWSRQGKEAVLLEEYCFEVKTDPRHKPFFEWLARRLYPEGSMELGYWREKMPFHAVVLSNEAFKDFCLMGCEVVTRTRIDNETGTVATGALFTEEYLPAESVLYTLAMASPIFRPEETKKDIPFLAGNAGKGEAEAKAVLEHFLDNKPSVFQLGANATLGKGLLRMEVSHDH